MIHEEIVKRLASEGRASPMSAITLLMRLTDGNLSQFSMIAYFKNAFPAIPLHILQHASLSQIVIGPSGISNEEFTEMLRPWFEE